jgi:hypothetical protein
LATIEKSITSNSNFLYTIASYITVLVIVANLNSLKSLFVGLIVSAIYFAINAIFLGNAFFAKESAFIRLTFGVLLLIMLLGLVGWSVMIIYKLDVTMSALVLAVASTITSFLNVRMRHKLARK